MPENPAELPAETGEGGSGTFRFPRGGIGGPNELPPYDWTRLSVVQLVSEVLQLRNRINTLENSFLSAKFQTRSVFFGGGIGGPNELPEGEGGGGGGGHIPHEIHEINELPIARFVTELSTLVSRFAQFEVNILQRLETLSERVNAIKR